MSAQWEKEWFTYNQSELGEVFKIYQEVMKHWTRVVPGHQLLNLSYEGLVEDQEAETRKLLEFCGLPWDDRCLEFYKTERAVRTASLAQVRQPMYRTSIGKGEKYKSWLPELSAELGQAGFQPMRLD